MEIQIKSENISRYDNIIRLDAICPDCDGECFELEGEIWGETNKRILIPIKCEVCKSSFLVDIRLDDHA